MATKTKCTNSSHSQQAVNSGCLVPKCLSNEAMLTRARDPMDVGLLWLQELLIDQLERLAAFTITMFQVIHGRILGASEAQSIPPFATSSWIPVARTGCGARHLAASTRSERSVPKVTLHKLKILTITVERNFFGLFLGSCSIRKRCDLKMHTQFSRSSCSVLRMRGSLVLFRFPILSRSFKSSACEGLASHLAHEHLRTVCESIAHKKVGGN